MKPVTWRAAFARGTVRAVALSVIVVIIALVVIAIQGGSGQRVATVAMIDIVIVVGIGIFTGNSGVISFGHIGFAGIGAYTVAILSATTESKQRRIPDAPLSLATVQVSPWLALVIALVVVAIAAAVLGLAIRRMGGTSAVLITLAVLVVTYRVLNDWVATTGGAEAFYGVPRAVSLPVAIVAMVVAVAVAGVFKESPIGLHLRAAREDELAAASSGVDIRNAKFVGWVLSAVVAGAGGALLALYLGSITPSDFYLPLTLMTIAMLFVGGVRGITGIVLGSVLITIGRELFRYLGDGPTIAGIELPSLPGLTDIFLGLVLVLVMLLRPKGLVHDWEIDQLWSGLRPRIGSDGRSAGRGARTGDDGTTAAPRPAQHRSEGRLQAKALTKRFGGVSAVQDVDIDLSAGTITGLIGPNGSGKTTILNMLSGVLLPTSGVIAHNGAALPPAAHLVAAAGITRTFQNIRLFADLTVADNIAVAQVAARRIGRGSGDVADVLIGELGLADALEQRAGTLPYGAQRRLELVRAAVLTPDFILLDEPVAGMNELESADLADVIRSLPDLVGCGVVVVDHDLPFILGLCSRILVMDSGRLIADGDPETVSANPEVISAYLGAGQ